MISQAQTEYEAQIEREVMQEVLGNDPVARTIKYRYFTSRSKGWRNGKRRLRRNWKEIRLVKYSTRGFTQWHKFPFDVYATEIMGEWADGELLKERIKEIGGGVKL